MKPVSVPVVSVGPGSQPEDEGLNYISMPSGMQTYSTPVLPEPEEFSSGGEARRTLDRVLATLDRRIAGEVAEAIDLTDLPEADLRLINQTLGEGEVSIQVKDGPGRIAIQESVFAGVWRVHRRDADDRILADWIEVAGVPEVTRQPRRTTLPPEQPEAGPGIVTAPALVTEILDRMGRAKKHVINLSLLPFTPEDGAYLDQALGRGPVSFLSRGYGNCRITATSLDRVWWVQYFNSQEALILNTIEITDMPEVAMAADEDLADSRERLAEVLEWLG